jgi:DNA modification methylase
VIQADAREALAALPEGAAELVFTSPPYFNARTQYSDHDSYEDYLAMVRQVIRATRRVLAEGRFFVLNASPVLLRRARRSEASRRIAVPFDIHRLFVEEGFDFMEDIVWVKPEGAGWATGRGRRFAADRHPLQYKPVPVTEQILVYRKRTHRLLDWNIRSHPEPARVARSRIGDGYEVTNVWRIKPAHRKEHPAVFPRELAERVVRYWSFEGDVVLDPFAGVGTTGAAAAALGRRFLLIERNPEYVRVIRRELPGWEGADPEKVHWRGGET